MVHQYCREILVVHEVQHRILTALRNHLGQFLRSEVNINKMQYLRLTFHANPKCIPQSGVISIASNNILGFNPDLFLLILDRIQYNLVGFILDHAGNLNVELDIVLFHGLQYDLYELVLADVRGWVRGQGFTVFELGFEGG
jgi:hypothetical protein